MPTPTPAPWRDAFLKHISSMSQATFTLSTIHNSTAPRARTCIFRSLWAELPPNDKNPAPRNPPLFQSDLPVFTTDMRMAKAGELGGGGGGGPVEAVFWAAEAQTQWRVRGRAWLLGPDVEGEGGRAAREAIGGRVRRVKGMGEGGNGEEWRWATEVTGHFGNLSPVMRGTFRQPAPGTPRAVPAKDGEGMGQKVEDLEDEMARKNFRVSVIVPEEVDQVDFSKKDDVRRWLYRFVGGGEAADQEGGGREGTEVIGEWEKCEVWP